MRSTADEMASLI